MTTQVDSETTPAAVEEFLNRPATLEPADPHVLHRQPALSPAIVLVLAAIVFTLLNERFYALQNLSLVAQQVAVVGSLAVGQTLIILTAGIDLSIGAVMVLSSLVMSKLVARQPRGPGCSPCSPGRSSPSPRRPSTGCWSPGSSCRRSSSPSAR